MKAISYVINGNRFLLLKDEATVAQLASEYDRLKNRDFWISVFNNIPFFTGYDSSQLYSTLSQIQDVNIDDFSFPTEQPRVELNYLEHPIKENVFIPVDSYNKYIQDERKWDLINLLRSKNVNKITFSKTEDIDQKEITELSEYIFKNEIIEYYSKEEIYEFNKEVKDNDYNSIWLSVEPEWKGIIKAINSGLTKGSISFTTEVSAA